MKTKIEADKKGKPMTISEQSSTQSESSRVQFLKTLLLIIVTAIVIPSGAFLVHFAWRANSVYAEMKMVKVEIAEAIASHSHRDDLNEVKAEIKETESDLKETDGKFTQILAALTKLEGGGALTQRDIAYLKEKIDTYVNANDEAHAAILQRLDKFEYQHVPAIVRDMGLIKERLREVEKERLRELKERNK